MIVIADTTPLDHLILIGHANVLEARYGRVIVPSTVLAELQAQAAPAKVTAWISHRPDWLEVDQRVFPPDPSLAHLDAGERDAILLARPLGRAFFVSRRAYPWDYARRSRHRAGARHERRPPPGIAVPTSSP